MVNTLSRRPVNNVLTTLTLTAFNGECTGSSVPFDVTKSGQLTTATAALSTGGTEVCLNQTGYSLVVNSQLD